MTVVRTKSKGVAYLLWCCCFIGLCGIHRFYIGKIGTGLLWLFTFGLLGIGQFIDLFTLGQKVDIYNGLRGGVGGGNQTVNQSQNVVVNLTVPSASPAPTAAPTTETQA